jgi:CheY-like chemotaxis protein
MGKILTVLLVDDDLDDQELLLEALREADPTLHCLRAGNGQEALHLLQQPGTPRPDLIFLDLNMPRMNGKTFLSRLMQLDAFRGVPVLIYTTSKLEEDVEETRRLGAAQFLTKPDSYEEIRRLAAAALELAWVE